MDQNNSKSKKSFLSIVLIIVLIALGFLIFSYRTQIKRFLGFATVTDVFLLRAMLPENNWVTTGHAWGENVGWISFQETNGGIYVGDYALTGYAWGENIGWISLNCEQEDDNTCGTVEYSVINDGAGNLSGFAWGENIGWIDFAPTNGGVTIDADGVFSGFAWGENIGWINFESTGNVTTNWRYQVDRPQCNNGLDDDGDGFIDYGEGATNDSSCSDITGNSEKAAGKNKVLYEESKERRELEQSTTTGRGIETLPTSTTTSPTHTPTTTPTTTPNNSNTPGKDLTPVNTVTLPVNIPTKLVIKDLPIFGGTGKNAFTFVPQITSFLYAPLPDSVLSVLNKAPKLKEYIISSGITTTQHLVALIRSPRPLTPPATKVPGLFVVSINDTPIRTYLSNDSMSGLSQLARVASGTEPVVSLVPLVSGDAIEGKLNNEVFYFSTNGTDIYAKMLLNGPGKYTLTTAASPIPLIIEVAPSITTSQTTNNSIFARALRWFNK